MRNIPLNNARLQTLLSNLIEKINASPQIVKTIARAKENKDALITDLDARSDEYLHRALTLKLTDYGYPRSALGCPLREMYDDFMKPVTSQVEKLGMYLGTPFNALVMAYPDNGYIGWHHNGNAPGYNILMTHSIDGNGRFKYWEDGQIKVIEDKPGWQVKVGYYPSERKEPDRVFWHEAETAKTRISVAWIIDHREMWQNMIETISEGEYDHDYILSQGPKLANAA